MSVEQLGQQAVELLSFDIVEAGEQFVLHGIGIPLEVLEMLPARNRNGDDVATPVGGIGLTADQVLGLEAVEDTVDIVAV
jgi:hypothetical protein